MIATLTAVLLVATAAGALAFLVLYVSLTRWWTTPSGRLLVAFGAGSLLATVETAVADSGAGPYWWQPWAHLAGVGSLAVVVWVAVVMLARGQLAHRRSRRVTPSAREHADM